MRNNNLIGTYMDKIRMYLLGIKGFKVLEAILEKYGSKIIDSIIIGRDRNIINDHFSEIINICKKNKIQYINRSEDNLKTDIFSIVVGWRWLIDLNRVKNLIIFHDSLLPKYRGFNPLVTCLIKGDSEIGVSALFAVEKFDQGDIIYQSKSKINYPIKIRRAIEIIKNNYIDVSFRVVEDIINGKQLPRTKQIEKEATYSLWRDEEDYHINWTWENHRIRRMIDAVGNPYLGAYTIVDNEKLRIIEAEELNDILIENRESGKVIYFENKCPVVVCGEGLLKITKMINEKSEKFALKKLRVRFQ